MDNLWDGGYELAIFLPISHRISETVQDKTKSPRFYSSLSGSRIPGTRFRLVPKSTTLDNNLNSPRTAIIGCAFLIYTLCLSEPTTKIWMKVDPYYQRQKCSYRDRCFNRIRFMQIFAGVHWRWGRQMRMGSSKMAIFLLILLAISSEPSYLSPLRPQLLYCAGSPLVALQWHRNTVWVKKIPPPWGLVAMFPKRLGIFQPNYFYVPIMRSYLR